MNTYRAQRGETVRFLLHTPLETDISGFAATCEMRSWGGTMRKLDTDAAPAATLAVTSFAGDADRGPGWYFTLSDTVCEALEPGRYILDARIDLSNGETTITDPWVLDLAQHVTEPAA